MLPPVEQFTALQREDAPWRAAVMAIAAQHGLRETWTRAIAGSAVVYLGARHVLKLLPPTWVREAEVERAALQACTGTLPVAIPRLVASGELEGWPYLVLTRLPGNELRPIWAGLSDVHRLELVREAAALLAALHQVPVPDTHPFPDAWSFLERPPAEVVAKHERDGTDRAWTLAIGAAIRDAEPPHRETESTVLVHGDVQPDHLLVDDDGHLCGLFDYGDVMTGPRSYDLAATACLMAVHPRGGAATFYAAYGAALDASLRGHLTVALLKQRYCALPFVLRTMPKGRRPSTLDELLELLHGG